MEIGFRSAPAINIEALQADNLAVLDAVPGPVHRADALELDNSGLNLCEPAQELLGLVDRAPAAPAENVHAVAGAAELASASGLELAEQGLVGKGVSKHHKFQQ